MVASIGSLGKFGLGAGGAGVAATRLDYVSEDLVCDEDFIDANGIRGTLSHSIERVRQGARRIHGPIRLQPNSLEWTYLLQWIMGGAPSGSGTVTYPLADTLITKDVQIDRIIKVPVYDHVAVDVATIRASQGEPVQLELQLVGIDETLGNAGSFPNLAIDTTTFPFVLMDATLSINSVSVQAREVELSINNHIDKERFFFSRTLTATNKLDRMISFSTSLPYGDFSALYATGQGGVSVVLTFTNGAAVLTFSMVKVAFPRKAPNTPGKVEVMLPLSGNAFSSGGTEALICLLNPGP